MNTRNSLNTSVALCTYNGERHILGQLISIANQSRLPEEIVIADDGSTDDTLDIVSSLVDDGFPIPVKILGGEKKPLGVTRNFERAVRATKGEVIVLADQDDLWEPTRVESAVKCFLVNSRLLLVACDARLVDNAGNQLHPSLISFFGSDPNEFAVDNALPSLLRRNILPGMSMALKRELIDIAGAAPVPWMHDYWWAVNAAARDAFQLDTEVRVMYRQHASNVFGAPARSICKRVGRLINSGSDAKRLAQMFYELGERLSDQEIAVEWIDAVQKKSNFEFTRSQLSKNGFVRSFQCLKLLAAGDSYHVFSSNGRLNVLRDILHSP